MNKKINIYFLLLFLIVLFSIISPYFLTYQNFTNIILSSSIIGIIAIGMSFVIATAGIDLSVGSIIAFSSCFSVVLFPENPIMIIIGCLLSASLVGLINGYVIGYGKYPAFIVTLALMSVVRGLGYIVTDGMPIYGLPETIKFIGQGHILGVQFPIIVFIFTFFCFYYLKNKTKLGRYFAYIGDNEKASYNAGINVSKCKLIVYVISAFLCGVAGLIMMGRMNTADPSSGLMYEMSAITATILGGTSLFGGKYTVTGTIAGVLVIGVLQNGLNLLNVPVYYQQVIIGIILILGVVSNKSKGASNADIRS
jgi:ribose/xylose/arabinose/galactoside ABC-type transport system permease subunit